MRVWVGGMYVLALWRSGGGRALELRVLVFVVEEPIGEAFDVAEGVAVEGVVEEVGFGLLARCHLVGHGHGFGGDDVDVWAAVAHRCVIVFPLRLIPLDFFNLVFIVG